ncbi:MAG: glycoside hydrolase family 15 protein [Pyrinomonadaceae bacterium]|nr:glycoside hydrolase family 15 protein [Pyrinomonadaceae bacterium]
MRSSLLKSTILPLAIIIAGFGGVIGLSGYLDRIRPALPADYDDSDLTMNGSRLKGFALGFEGLMADWYWMRSLQYIGGKIIKSNSDFVNIDDLSNLNPRLLYPMLQNATDLDPHFIAAYSYGAVVMPAIDKEKAIEIAQKGIVNNPSEWRLYQYLGYIYWKIGRYDLAADTYERGAGINGAPPFMRLMAAAMKTEGGSRSTAREIFRQMLADSDDPMVKLTAERRLNEIDSLDERDAIDKALADFRERTGRCAYSLAEITPSLLQVKLPAGNEFMVDRAGNLIDPTEAPYLLDKENCRVKLDAARTGLPIK